MIVFKNKKKQFEFEHNGFAVVELLTRDEAESLKNFYKSLKQFSLIESIVSI
jgi:saccharopine dehydrogenase-like NADP-dependent oxidoreductase